MLASRISPQSIEHLSTSTISIEIGATTPAQGSISVQVRLLNGAPVRRWESGALNLSNSTVLTLGMAANTITSGTDTLLESLVVEITTNFNQPVQLDRLKLGTLICEQCTAGVADAPSDRVPSTVVEKKFEVLLPQAAGLDATVVATSTSDLRINDGSFVFDSTNTSTNYGTVAKTSLEGTSNFGVSARAGRIFSRSEVDLRGSHIFGDVIYGGSLTKQSGTVVDGSEIKQQFAISPALQGTYYFPKSDAGLQSYTRAAGAVPIELSPGNYGTLSIHDSATVKLLPGSYTFRSLILETGSVLDLPNSAEGHRIYVRDTMILRGSSGPSQDRFRGNVLFVYDGTASVPLTYRLSGTFVAPNAQLDLATTFSNQVAYRGAYYAKAFTLHQNSRLRHVPYLGGDCETDVVHQCGTKKPGCGKLLGCEDRCSFADFETIGLPEVCSAMTEETPDEPVWGFADLHAHPATHLGFGAKVENGELSEPGLFHGEPTGDLEACHPDTHTGFDLDFVRHETRQTIMSSLDSKAGHIHTPNGGSSMSSWPSARSISHQQMHVDWVRRAHQGGMRLLFASVADTQLLSQLWNNSFNPLGNSVKPEPGWSEKEHAANQLRYVTQLAADNSDFMRIVKTPKEAREAIRDGKLAIVLSLEMDRLSLDDILELREEFGVAHVIPIHLVNNGFGGTAIYDELFEASNYFLNDFTFQTTLSERVTYRLPQDSAQALVHGPAGSILPGSIDKNSPGFIERPTCGTEVNGISPPFGYGLKNAIGLREGGVSAIRRLMDEGLMVDVAHMSDLAATMTLEVAEQKGVPVMSSHGGLRDDRVLTEEDARSGGAVSERALTYDQAKRIGRLGGVLGIGTAGGLNARRLFRFYGGDAVRFGRPNNHDDNQLFTWGLVDRKLFSKETLVDALRLRLATGADDKRDDTPFVAWIELRNGTRLEWSIAPGVKFDDHTRQPAYPLEIDTTSPTKLHDIVRAGISRTGGGNDEWKVTELAMDWLDASGNVYPLFQRRASVTEDHDGHFLRVNSNSPGWTEHLAWPEDKPVDGPLIHKVKLELWTGDDDLGDRGATVTVSVADACNDNNRTLAIGHLDASSARPFEIELTSPVPASDIRNITVTAKSNCHDPPISLDIIALGGFAVSPLLAAPGSFVGIDPGTFSGFGTVASLKLFLDNINSGCISQDNWDIDRVRLTGLDAAGNEVHLFSEHQGHPWTRLTGNRDTGLLYEGVGKCDLPDLDDPAEILEIAITTGKDDLKPESHPVVSVVSTTGTLLGTVELNPSGFGDVGTGSFLRTNGVIRTILTLPPWVRVRDLGEIRIESNLQTGDFAHDDWDVDSIAVAVAADPVTQWNNTYRTIASVMGGRGVALGTDLNGLQDQIPAASQRLWYPFAVASPRGQSSTLLGKSTGPSSSSTTEFSLETHGLAHYGMLADFVADLRKVPRGGADSADRLFRSAEDVLRMWEKVERKRVAGSSTNEPCSPAVPKSGGNTGNFDTTGSVCYKIEANIAGWGCSNMDGRSLLVNDIATSCGGTLPPKVNGSYYFEVSAGAYPWASIYWW